MEIHGPRHAPIHFVAVGHLAVDHRSGQTLLGGAAAYACLTASRLGLSAAMVTAVGEEFDFGPLDGIEIHARHGEESTSFENVYDDQARRQRLLARAHPLTAKDLEGLDGRLDSRTAVLYCPIAREVEAPLVRLRPEGLCGLAPQGFLRDWDEEGSVRPRRWPTTTGVLADVDVVSMSRDDAPWPDELVSTLSGRLLAVTEGPRGARLYWEGKALHIPAYPTFSIDPTGAGDVFAASLLLALREGQPPPDAACFAACAASFAVERVGVEGVPRSREVVDARLRDHRRRFEVRETDA